MVRPIKEGLKYFPLDCILDRKIEILEAEYKLEGFAIYIKLLQECYQNNKGEIQYIYNNGFSAGKMYGKRWDIVTENIEKMIRFMVEIELFDKIAFKNSGILTSNGIKKRIEKILHDRRKDREKKSYRKGKQLKSPPKMPEKEIEIEKEIYNIQKVNTKTASPIQTKKQFLTYVMLTEAEYDKLAVKLGADGAKDMITRLNNYIGSTGRRYKSHYHTILTWLDKDARQSAKVA